MRKGSIIVILLIVVFWLPVAAQNDDCELTLGRANEEFNNGHFTSIAGILQPCMRSFSAEQKQRAYLLLTETSLLLDDASGARASYLALLKANPEFVTDTAIHPIDVIYLSKKFTSTPIFSWFAKAGPSTALPRVIYDLNSFGENGIKDEYNLRLGYQGSVGADYNFSDHINARLELQFEHTIVESTTRNFWTKDTREMVFSQNWLSAPFTAVYSDFIGKYRPYGYVGYAFHYLLPAEKTRITLTNNRPATTTDSEREETPQTSADLKTKYMTNRFNQSLVFGGGIKAKLGLDFVFIDLGYRVGLKNITSLNNIYADNASSPGSQDAATRWANARDIMRLDNLSVSVGFLRPLYKPRELKRARTNSVMKHMRKK